MASHGLAPPTLRHRQSSPAHDAASPATGEATTVVAPLSSTVAPVSRAASRAQCRGFASISVRSTVARASPKPASHSKIWESSPACGVRTLWAPRGPSATERAAASSAPASSTAGSSASITACTRAAWDSSPTTPGPASHAWTCTSHGWSSEQTTSGLRASTIPRAVESPRKRTMPAPAWTAAWVHMMAAPG